MTSKQDAKDLINSMDVGEWSLSDEREFTEGLFAGRFDFFLVVFSIFVTAGFANAFTTFRSVVFYAGAALLFMVWLTLLRAFKKRKYVLDKHTATMPNVNDRPVDGFVVELNPGNGAWRVEAFSLGCSVALYRGFRGGGSVGRLRMALRRSAEFCGIEPSSAQRIFKPDD